MAWDPRHLPSQLGKTFVVTGGNAGIGYFISEQLAFAGARVILASRNPAKASGAVAVIRTVVPSADVDSVHLDLSSLGSVSVAAAELRNLGPIDGLMLNAGLTAGGPARLVTIDGLELGVGTNYLGHFALTAQVFGSLTPTARVVTIGSRITTLKRAQVNDLLQERGSYSWTTAYANSKHAMQAFGFELDRRLRASGSGVRALVSHPGFALDVQGPRRPGVNDDLSVLTRLTQNLLRPMTQGKDRGAWPMVRALIDPDARGGEYYGPRGALKGKPVLARPVAQDRDPRFGRMLWERSEGWTGLRFTL
jgi:NAD(P)-dependent dehydrogenase (short-subunit alcohol dehydrogenase family)